VSATTACGASLPATGTGDWFGHPRGLTILFLTEMWEKFSYFGMRALLVYYMTKSLAMPQAQASWIYGIYTAFTYFTPILGGLVADRLLGRRRAVILGGAIMALGHFMMAFETLFYPALAMIGLGNGLFLPSLPSQVQTLYPANDPRLASAYSVYYVGVNLGGVLAPLICGTLGELFGWHWGFGAAGIGMCVGLVIYIIGNRHLPLSVGEVQPTETATEEERQQFARRIGLLLGIVLMVIVFRGAYEQVGNTVALWADDVDRTIGTARTIPATWFQSLNPLLVFALTPIVLAIWRYRARRGHKFAPLRRMAFGAGIVAVSYVLLASASYLSHVAHAPAHWIWLVAFFVIYTAGELCILPVGLALFGQLAPRALAATMISLWFSASFAGNLLAGSIGTLWSRFDNVTFFLIVAAVALLAGCMLLLVDRPTRKLLHKS
jgi:proton-dependent oligopeptide transporter, POT family